MLNLIAICTFVAATLLVLGLASWWRRRRTPAGTGEAGGLDQEVTPAERRSFLERWEEAAEHAGLGWKRQVFYVAAAIGGGLGAMLYLMGHQAAGLAVLLAGLYGPYGYVRRQQAVRSARLLRQLPQTLFLAAGILRSGGTLLQAVDGIAAEVPAPMGTEFRQIARQIRLQVPPHVAMLDAQKRVGVREFAAMVVATRIASELGGNLAQLYEEIGRWLVEAENGRRSIRAFTTEGRLSTNLIALLPFLVMGLMQFLSPGYYGSMLQSWSGRILIGLCIGTIGLGWWLIRRMVDIRID